jgi:23S rRNA A2030 N6-methylase RlmJ
VTSTDVDTIREVLESHIAALTEALHRSTCELREGQSRIERETHRRLDRIEKQTAAHNGRMTALEKQHIHDEAIRVEREHIAHDAAAENTASHRRWANVTPSVIGGTVSGVLILLASLIATGKF